MKKFKIVLTGLVAASLVTLISCNNGNQKSTASDEQSQDSVLVDSLRSAQAAEAELNALIDDIDNGMTEIKNLEGIISSTNVGNESASKKTKIKDDMQQIMQLLQQRRQRIAELEEKMRQSGHYSATNKRLLEDAKSKIDTQTQEIENLRDELKKAKIEIADLNTKVSDLNTKVENVTSEKQEAQNKATELANELNTCFYVIGSNKELKEYGIISKKFLGKTKVLESDNISKNYFTKGDKRSLSTIPLHSTKAKLWTSQPQDSYQITEDANGVKTLVITNATKFWEKSNFLVIQIN